MSLQWLFLYIVLERIFELYLSHRHCRVLISRGGCELFPETFPSMVALHTLFLLALLGESYPWYLQWNPYTGTLFLFLVILQFGRYWCIFSLGENWNTRIVLIPGGTVKKTGPYRYTAHPNYLVVTLEFLLLPLLMHAPYTLAVFFPANLLILRQRISREEKTLRNFTDYNEHFPL